MIMTHADVNFYSPSNDAEFELDLDEGSSIPAASLFVTHIHEGGSMVSGRHFLTLDQLRTLRDLLNEKLPPQFKELAQLKDETKEAANAAVSALKAQGYDHAI